MLPQWIVIVVPSILQTDLLIVEDMRKHPRCKDLPSVKNPPHKRFYCAMPLINPKGMPSAHFAFGTQARSCWTQTSNKRSPNPQGDPETASPGSARYPRYTASSNLPRPSREYTSTTRFHAARVTTYPSRGPRTESAMRLRRLSSPRSRHWRTDRRPRCAGHPLGQ